MENSTLLNEGEQMKQMKLSDEEIQILIDGTEDTRNHSNILT